MIPAVGKFVATLQWKGRSCQKQVFVVDKSHDALIGNLFCARLQVRELDVTKMADKVNDNADILSDFRKQASGLDDLSTRYKTTLLFDYKPYADAYKGGYLFRYCQAKP